jgi:hypothetical protein
MCNWSRSKSLYVADPEGEACLGTPPPRVFLQKSVQAVENKGCELQKERQERQRARNSVKRRDL